MIFPIEQYTTIEIRRPNIDSKHYILNILETAMEDSKMKLRKRTESKLTYVKADILKYAHPRNFLHNISFEINTFETSSEIKISTKNWEYLGLISMINILQLLNSTTKVFEVFTLSILLIIVMIGIKYYFINLIKTNLLALINEV